MCEAQETADVEGLTDRQLQERIYFTNLEILALQKAQAAALSAALAQLQPIMESFAGGGSPLKALLGIGKG